MILLHLLFSCCPYLVRVILIVLKELNGCRSDSDREHLFNDILRDRRDTYLFPVLMMAMRKPLNNGGGGRGSNSTSDAASQGRMVFMGENLATTKSYPKDVLPPSFPRHYSPPRSVTHSAQQQFSWRGSGDDLCRDRVAHSQVNGNSKGRLVVTDDNSRGINEDWRSARSVFQSGKNTPVESQNSSRKRGREVMPTHSNFFPIQRSRFN